MEKLRQISSRHYYGELVTEFYKTGVGAEIGVFDGEFAEFMSKTWPGKILCVDRWDAQDGYPQRGYEAAKQRLHGTKCEMVKGMSVDVSKTVEDGSLDWIYIDADHSYEGVSSDYAAWYPKVRDGGLISGHDYGENGYGVKKFVDGLGIKFLITKDDKHPETGLDYQTWYFIKDEKVRSSNNSI